MAFSKTNKFISLLLTVNLIGGGVGFDVAASTAADDNDEEVVVSVDLKDHLVQFGAIPGEDEAEEISRIRPQFVSGDYDRYRADFLHLRSQKHKNANDPDDAEKSEEDDQVPAEPVDKAVEEQVAEETKETEATEAAEPEVEETKETEAADPEIKESEVTESEDIEPAEPKETKPSVTEPEKETVETSDGQVTRYNTELQLSNVKKLLDTACKNWDGKSKEIKADVTGLGVTAKTKKDADGYTVLVGGNLSETVSYFINTHGEYFFLDHRFGWSYNSEEVTSITLYAMSGFSKTHVNEFNTKVESIMSQIDPDWTDLEKALFLHDYLVTHCDYDTDTSNYHYDAYNCIVKGSCVCQGYSLAYDYLCRLAGVSCYFISSYDINHAWNLVKIDGNEYFIDCTWDDPFYSNTNKPFYKARCSHNFFLLSHDAMYNKQHKTSDWVLDGTKSANKRGTDTTYDKYFWSSSVSRFAPISGHKWAYVLPNAAKVMSYDFLKNSPAEAGTVSLDSYSTVATFKGEVYVSTLSKVYKIDSDKNVTTVASYSGSDGKIYGIDISGSTLTYYIYNGVTKYVAKKTCQLSADWKQVGDTWYYVDPSGVPATGLTPIGGYTYLFDDNGAMLTGWHKIDGKKYYFRSSGEMATGWELIGSKYYYFNSKGQMKTGFITTGSSTYYCNESGVRLTGWQTIGGKTYYFSSNKGKMATGWKTISKKTYFFSEEGVMRTGFRVIGGKTYYFTSAGVMKTGWFKKSGKSYYATSKGVVYMKKWKKTGGKWYYLGSDGIMLVSCTKKISGKKYKFNSKGVCTNKK